MSNANEDKLVSIVCKLAADLHDRDSEKKQEVPTLSFKMELTPGTLPHGVTHGDGKLAFNSISTRNNLAAAHHFNTQKSELGLKPSMDWLNYIVDLYVREDKRSGDLVSGRVIAHLHRYFDVLAFAAKNLTRENTFGVLFMLGAAIPYLDDISIDSLYALTEAQSDFTGGDLAGGHFFSLLAKGLTTKIEIAQAIINRQKQDITEKTASLYTSAAAALAAVAPAARLVEVLRDAQSTNPMIKSAALQSTVGLLEKNKLNSDELEQLQVAIRKALASNEPGIREDALRAIMQSCEETNEFDGDVKTLCLAGNTNALFCMSMMLHVKSEFDRADLRRELLPELCRAFALSNIRTTFLDSVLSSLITEDTKLLIKSLEEWAVSSWNGSHDKDITKALNGTITKLSLTPKVFSRLISAWMASPNIRLAFAARDIISFFSRDSNYEISFDVDFLSGLDLESFERLVFRTLSLVLSPETKVNLLCLLLQEPTLVARYEILLVTSDALCLDLGYDYPHIVVPELEKICAKFPTGEVHSRSREALESIEEKHFKLKNLPHRKELQPSSILVNAFRKKRSSDVNASFKESQSKSVFAKLATKIPIKAGNQLFSPEHIPFESKLELKKIEVKQTIPTSLICDPVGLEMRRLMYLMES